MASWLSRPTTLTLPHLDMKEGLVPNLCPCRLVACMGMHTHTSLQMSKLGAILSDRNNTALYGLAEKILDLKLTDLASVSISDCP